MKTVRPLALAALLLATAAAPATLLPAAPAQAEPRGMMRITTLHSYPDLVKKLDAAVKKNGMAVVTRASATVGAKRLGKTIPGNMVVGVFHPRFAIRMLAASVRAGYEAPIRFYITEEPNGRATLAYRKPSDIFRPYRDGGPQLMQLANELDTIFAQIAIDAAR